MNSIERGRETRRLYVPRRPRRRKKKAWRGIAGGGCAVGLACLTCLAAVCARRQSEGRWSEHKAGVADKAEYQNHSPQTSMRPLRPIHRWTAVEVLLMLSRVRRTLCPLGEATNSSCRGAPWSCNPTRIFSTKPESSEDDYARAREWYKGFNPLKSLHDIGEVTYSRSSGPGGQNVNKYALLPSHIDYN